MRVADDADFGGIGTFGGTGEAFAGKGGGTADCSIEGLPCGGMPGFAASGGAGGFTGAAAAPSGNCLVQRGH